MNASDLTQDAVRTTWEMVMNPELSEQMRVQCRDNLQKRRSMIALLAKDPDVSPSDRIHFARILSDL